MPEYTTGAARTHVVSHQAYIAKGNCSSVNWAKAWCNRLADHGGQHYARSDGGEPRYVEWSSIEAHGCPCDRIATTVCIYCGKPCSGAMRDTYGEHVLKIALPVCSRCNEDLADEPGPWSEWGD